MPALSPTDGEMQLRADSPLEESTVGSKPDWFSSLLKSTLEMARNLLCCLSEDTSREQVGSRRLWTYRWKKRDNRGLDGKPDTGVDKTYSGLSSQTIDSSGNGDLGRVTNKRHSSTIPFDFSGPEGSPLDIFANGQYQDDLQRMVKREMSEEVCGTEAIRNDVGYLLVYPSPDSYETLALNPESWWYMFLAPERPWLQSRLFCGILLQMTLKGQRQRCAHSFPLFQGIKSYSNCCRIVVPTQGIMSHWKSEIEKFAPQLRIYFYSSSNVGIGMILGLGLG